MEPASPQALADNACEAMALGIESGLSYLLPMLYNQGLLEHYPNITRLSNGYKKAVYDGEREPLAIDSRVLQFKLVSNSKLTTDSQRLAQQSLYIQAQEALSKHVSQPRFPWRRDFIKKASES